MGEVTPSLSKPARSVRTVTGWTILLMVVLRVAIGWHFLYEGIWKIKSGTFSATPYLLASSGPMKSVFRGMVFDADGFARIVREFQYARIDERAETIANFYKLDDKQQEALNRFVEDKKHKKATPEQIEAEKDPAKKNKLIDQSVDQVVDDPDFQNQVEGYRLLLKQVAREEKQIDPKFRAERMAFNQKKADTARGAMLARIEKAGSDIDPAKMASVYPEAGLMLTPKQVQLGPLPTPQLKSFPGKQLSKLGMKFSPRTLTFWIDLSMMFGLCAVGACLILGLFTRLSALGGVFLLALFYFSMPPWPGLPEPAMSEGHYLFVNKNLIELIACLMFASSRVGRWIGLDAFFGAMSDRRKRKRAETAMLPSQSIPQNRLFAPDARPPVRDSQRV